MPRLLIGFKTASVAVVALGTLSLAVCGQLSTPVAIVALLSSLLLLPRRRLLAFPNLVWNLVGLAGLGLIGLATFVVHVPPLAMVAHLTIFFQIYRMLVRQTDRDTLFCFLIAFTQLLLAAILTIEISFLVVLVMFAVALTWALSLLRIKQGFDQSWRSRVGAPVEQQPPRGAYRELDGLLSLPFVTYVFGMTLVLLVGSATVFLLLPRLHLGLAQGSASTLQVSGFSDRVRLGDIGSILRSNEPVMRVEVTDIHGSPVSMPLYYHGLALDTFDGQSWSLADEQTFMAVNRRYNRADLGLPMGTTHVQHYVVEPISSRVIFWVPAMLGMDSALPEFEVATTEGYYYPKGTGRPEHTVYSSLTRPDPEDLRAAGTEYPPAIVSRYLQLPAVSPRVTELGRRWVNMGTTPYDGVLVVQQHLRDDYVYSLDQPSAGADDPVDHFLFVSQEGHCEFYATAMAVLLRASGIPARVVNGFHGGEYNPAGKYFLVRQRHAHSWVEVWFPGHGWQVFDPTPVSDEGSGGARTRLGARLGQWADLAGFRWRHLVLGYDQAAQFGSASWLQERVARLDLQGIGEAPMVDTDTEAGDDGSSAAGIGLALLVVLALVALVSLAVTRRSAPMVRALPRGPARRFATLVWRALALVQQRIGDDGAPYPTPLEVAQRADRADGSGEIQAVALIRRYYAVRYGGRAVTEEDLEQGRATVRRLKRWKAA